MIWASYGRQYMKKYLILFIPFLIIGCAPMNYNEVTNMGYKYTALAESEKLIGANRGGWGASNYSQKDANQSAMEYCQSAFNDCVLTHEGRTYVYNNSNKKSKTASLPKKQTKRPSKSTGGGSGSAFFVTNKGHIITNYHVVENCRSTPKIKYKNQDVEAKVIAKDTTLDLALLKAELRNTKYVSLSGDQPKKLQRIIASGYPFGEYISDDLKFSSGIVSALKGPGDDSTLVQVDAALNPGNSGGPIVDEESGKLVAVSVMGMKKSISEGQNFGIKTSSVKNFLQTNKVKVPSSWFGASDVAKLLEDTTLYTFCR